MNLRIRSHFVCICLLMHGDVSFIKWFKMSEVRLSYGGRHPDVPSGIASVPLPLSFSLSFISLCVKKKKKKKRVRAADFPYSETVCSCSARLLFPSPNSYAVLIASHPERLFSILMTFFRGGRQGKPQFIFDKHFLVVSHLSLRAQVHRLLTQRASAFEGWEHIWTFNSQQGYISYYSPSVPVSLWILIFCLF